MRHLDLFSGIGGFALAMDRVWDDVEHVFCDNEPFAQAVLQKHWPDSPVYADIRTLTHSRSERRREISYRPFGDESAYERWCTQNNYLIIREDKIDLLTGGFPCQPFSAAGRRRGEEDDRFLWPEMCRVIGEFKPTWVIAENVRGLLTQGGGVVFERVCTDLEALDYEVQPIVIPAVAVSAPHRRDRVWFVAYDAGRINGGHNGESQTRQGKKLRESTGGGDAPDTDTANDIGRRGRSASNRKRMEAHKQEGEGARRESARRWQDPWLEVATRLCTLDDGLSNGLVRPKGWRNAALKAAGNSIVPQVAEQIMRAIKESDRA